MASGFFAGLVQGLGGTLSQQQAIANEKKQREREFETQTLLHYSENPDITGDEQLLLIQKLEKLHPELKKAGLSNLIAQQNERGIQTAPAKGELIPSHQDLTLAPPPFEGAPQEGFTIKDVPSITARNTPAQKKRRGEMTKRQVISQQEINDKVAEQQALETGRLAEIRARAAGQASLKHQTMINKNTREVVSWNPVTDPPLGPDFVTESMYRQQVNLQASVTRDYDKELYKIRLDPTNAGKTEEELGRLTTDKIKKREKLKEDYTQGLIDLNELRRQLLPQKIAIEIALMNNALRRTDIESDRLQLTIDKAEGLTPEQRNAIQTNIEQFQALRQKVFERQSAAAKLTQIATGIEETTGDTSKIETARAKAAEAIDDARRANEELEERALSLKTTYGDRIEVIKSKEGTKIGTLFGVKIDSSPDPDPVNVRSVLSPPPSSTSSDTSTSPNTSTPTRGPKWRKGRRSSSSTTTSPSPSSVTLTEAEIRAAGGGDAAVKRARDRGLLAP